MRQTSLRAVPLGQFFIACVAQSIELRRGELTVVTPDGVSRRFVGADPGRACKVVIRNWLGFLKALPFGSAALGMAYADGYFDADDLVALAQLQIAPNKHSALPLVALRRALQRLQNWRLRRHENTRQGARRNIRAHYDIGNDFYTLWLDRGMTYSAALFEGVERDLETAQSAKYQRALDTVGARDGGHILEIGCGWGGFAEFAGRAGYKVTAITLSPAQLQHSRTRIAAAGLDDRVTVELLDYRDVKGTFDGVVSIEMIEAVGEAYWSSFFSKLVEVLCPGSRALVQTTTVPDERFESYRTGSDYIREQIFPGGMLISPGRIASEARAADLMVADVLLFGRDYAKTLALWCVAFDRQVSKIRRLGFDDRFVRAWRLYLLGCQGLFEAGDIDVGQFCLERTCCGR
jgi:cyclopropane-fatty-acyl-phospholipid synthase